MIAPAVFPSNRIDVNLKLFDVLGRLAICGFWLYQIREVEDEGNIGGIDFEIKNISTSLRNFIINNPSLLSPLKEDQTIDIMMADLFLLLNNENHIFLKGWINNIFEKISHEYIYHGYYPSVINFYNELLSHPVQQDDYRHEATVASILYPTLALLATFLKDLFLYEKIKEFKKNNLKHCNFQFWYIDDFSEENLYTNKNPHGYGLVDISLEKTDADFLSQLFEECKNSEYFDTMSTIKSGLWPIIIVACWHYKYPLSIQLIKKIINSNEIMKHILEVGIT